MINYQREMEAVLRRLEAENRKPLLLLHCCCGPCSSAVLERLAGHFQIAAYFYNPNIEPESEFQKRFEEEQSLIGRMPGCEEVRLLRGPYENDRFREIAAGMEQLPEGGERCTACFRLRLEKSAAAAAELGAEYFTTTLTISPLKDAGRLNALGGELGRKYGIRYLYSDFKKQNGYARSCALSREYGLYRQDYCGCAFSKRDREAEKRRRAEQAETEVKCHP